MATKKQLLCESKSVFVSYHIHMLAKNPWTITTTNSPIRDKNELCQHNYYNDSQNSHMVHIIIQSVQVCIKYPKPGQTVYYSILVHSTALTAKTASPVMHTYVISLAAACATSISLVSFKLLKFHTKPLARSL